MMIDLIILAVCAASAPADDGDTITLQSITIYWDSSFEDDSPAPADDYEPAPLTPLIWKL